MNVYIRGQHDGNDIRSVTVDLTDSVHDIQIKVKDIFDFTYLPTLTYMDVELDSMESMSNVDVISDCVLHAMLPLAFRAQMELSDDGIELTYINLVKYIKLGNDDVVRLLLDAGLDVSSQTSDDDITLHDVIACDRSSMIGMFIENGANLECKDCRGHTPYAISVIYDMSMCTNELIMRGCKIVDINIPQFTPLC